MRFKSHGLIYQMRLPGLTNWVSWRTNFLQWINCMSVWEWLEWERKCSETVVGLDLTLVLKVKNDHHFTPHGRYELNKLTSLPMCGFIAQLVEQRTGNAEVTGSNPVAALIFFRLLLSNYCDDHSSLHLQPQFKNELFHMLHIISLLTGDMNSKNWPRSQCLAS